MKKLIALLLCLSLCIGTVLYAKSNPYILGSVYESYFAYLPLTENLEDQKGELTSGTITRESSATYIDSDGVLQTADGDSASTQASQEDETGYTYGQGVGSFYEDPTPANSQAWFSGEVLTGVYTADWSADADNFDDWTDGATPTGNQDDPVGDGAYNNCMTITAAADDGYHYVHRNSTVTLSVLTKVVMIYYLPSGNSEIDGFTIKAGTATIGDFKSSGSNPAVQDKWSIATCYGIPTSNTGFEILLTDGSAVSFAEVGGNDVLHIASLVVSTVVSLSSQFASTGNLLKLVDSSSKVAYGFLGAAEGGWAVSAEKMPNQVDRDFSGASAWANVDINAYDETDDLTITADAATQYCTCLVASVPTTVGKQYVLTFDLANLVSTWTLKSYDGTHTIGTIDTEGANEFIFTAMTTGGLRIVAVANDSSGDFDNFSLKEVTTADAQAVTIYKEPSLATEGYAIKEADFDMNDDSITFDVYPSVPTTGSGAEASFESNGLLYEGAGVNWFLSSGDLSSSWSLTNLKSSYGSVTDPTGSTNTKCGMVADSTADETRYVQQTINIFNDNEIVTFSTFVKAGTKSWARLLGYCKDGATYPNCYFNLSGSGSVGTTTGCEDQGIERLGSTDWYRIWIAYDVKSGATNNTFRIHAAEADGDHSFQANEDDLLLYTFGMQVEQTPYATSYIPTTTIPSYRTSMTAKWTISTAFKNLMGDVADSPFTMVVEWTPKFSYGDTSANSYVITMGSTTKHLLRHQTTGTIYSRDGTNDSLVDPDYASGTTYIFALRVYDDSGTMKFEIGEKHGGSWTWDASPATYDGSFNPGTYLQIGYGNEYPFNIKNIYFYLEEKSQSWVEGHF